MSTLWHYVQEMQSLAVLQQYEVGVHERISLLAELL